MREAMTLRLPDALKAALRAQADRNHRSANAEALVILEAALGERETDNRRPRETGSRSPSAPPEAAATSSGRAAQGTGGTAGPSPGGALAKPRKRDPLWDAFVEIFGAEAAGIERGRWNKAALSLRQCGATADQVRSAAATYRSEWPGVTMTPMALAANWTILTANGKTPKELQGQALQARIAAMEGGTR